jgi:hypothetical protein
MDSLFWRIHGKPKLGSSAAEWLFLFLFVALVSPTVISYSPYQLSWDESYYLGQAICANQAVYAFNATHLSGCMDESFKGPIMQVINLPWGKAGGTELGIGLAFVGLALVIWILVLSTYLACRLIGIPPTSLLLAGATIALTPFLRSSAGAMMTDTLLGWCIALALMLIPLEYCRPSGDVWPSILRGVLWGFVFDIGMLSKVTFIFFLCLIGMALLPIRERYSGEWPLRYAFLGCIVGFLPAILIWWFHWRSFLGFAFRVAWGDQARLWAVMGMTPAGYLKDYFSHLGLALIPLSILAFLFVRGIAIENHKRFARLLPVALILLYLGIAAKSQNRDRRFSIPVTVALPICLAWTSLKAPQASRVGVAPALVALATGGILSIPMIRRPDIVPIQKARVLIRKLCQEPTNQSPSVRIVLADDGPSFNINTFLLAKQFEEGASCQVELDTLVYDSVNQRSLQDSLKRIDTATFVVFLKPGIAAGPDWSRVHDSEFRAYCEKVGTLQDSAISLELDVFKIGSHSS